jgi:hypothetical protein
VISHFQRDLRVRVLAKDIAFKSGSNVAY